MNLKVQSYSLVPPVSLFSFTGMGNGVSQGKMKPKPCGQMTPINRSLNSTKKIFEKSVLWRRENLFFFF